MQSHGFLLTIWPYQANLAGSTSRREQRDVPPKRETDRAHLHRVLWFPLWFLLRYLWCIFLFVIVLVFSFRILRQNKCPLASTAKFQICQASSLTETSDTSDLPISQTERVPPCLLKKLNAWRVFSIGVRSSRGFCQVLQLFMCASCSG